jgi:hypothetical protein
MLCILIVNYTELTLDTSPEQSVNRNFVLKDTFSPSMTAAREESIVFFPLQ